MYFILIITLGAVWGSFLHATAIRTERFLLKSHALISKSKIPRYHNYLRLSFKNFFCSSHSKCDYCRVRVPWFYNIPILSYFILRGKCINCKNKIFISIIASEIIFSLIFLLVALKFSNSFQDQFFAIIFFSLIFLVIHFDFKYLLTDYLR